MNTEVLSDDPSDAGLAWITLLLSSGLLGALFVWSLQNPSVLLPPLSAVESSEQESKNTVEANDVISQAGMETAQSNVDTGDVETQVTVAQPAVDEVAGTPLEQLKRQELATLPGLAGRVRYSPQQSEPVEGSDKLLNRMFELLFLYIDSDVVVKISSGDFEDDEKNLELSKARAQNLVAYLVGRGLDEKRFEIVPLGREQLPLGGHRVNVYAKDI